MGLVQTFFPNTFLDSEVVHILALKTLAFAKGFFSFFCIWYEGIGIGSDVLLHATWTRCLANLNYGGSQYTVGIHFSSVIEWLFLLLK